MRRAAVVAGVAAVVALSGGITRCLASSDALPTRPVDAKEPKLVPIEVQPIPGGFMPGWGEDGGFGEGPQPIGDDGD